MPPKPHTWVLPFFSVYSPEADTFDLSLPYDISKKETVVCYQYSHNKNKKSKKINFATNTVLTICTMGTCLDLHYVGTNNIAKWPTILQKSDSRKTKAAHDFSLKVATKPLKK